MKYNNDIPFFDHGLPLDRIGFSGGRVSADIAKHGGLTSIKYYGRQQLNATAMFEADPISAWQQLFRLFVRLDDRMYYAEFNDTSIYPYGYESFCCFEDVSLKHRLTLLNDALIFEIEVIKAPANCNLSFVMTVAENCVKTTRANRQWDSFVLDADNNIMIAKALDDNRQQKSSKAEVKFLTQNSQFESQIDDYVQTSIALTSSQPMIMHKTPVAFEKDYARIAPVDGYANFIILFGHDEEKFCARWRKLQLSAREECEQLRAEYASIQDNQTQIAMPEKTVQSLLNNSRNILNSLRIKDIPGGMRAADSSYWIWGWDSMVFSDAVMMSGDHQFVEDMLDFYRRTAHPKYGIFHSINLAGQPELTMAPAAQTLYSIMLYNYYVLAQNIDIVDEYYQFARQIILRAIDDEVEESGLIRGVALYPDFPEYLGQTGNDISSFNNSITYQALRCMEKLANIAGKSDDAGHFQAFAAKMKVGFNKYLFDDEKGYYFDSVSAEDFSPRRHYPVYAVLHLTAFADELVEGKVEQIARFMHDNLKVRTGVAMLPRWDNAFMADGNQLGIYMPVTESFYRHMMRLGGYEESLMPVIKQEWSRIMIPEALTAEAVNHGLTPDNPGRKQAFGLKAWYSLFFSYYLGISFEVDQLIVTQPMATENVDVKRFYIGNKLLTFEYRFSNNTSQIELYLNHKRQSDNRISYAQLQDADTITIIH